MMSTKIQHQNNQPTLLLTRFLITELMLEGILYITSVVFMQELHVPTDNKPAMTVEIFDCNLSPSNFLFKGSIKIQYRMSFFMPSFCSIDRTTSRQFTATTAVLFCKDYNLRCILLCSFSSDCTSAPEQERNQNQIRIVYW